MELQQVYNKYCESGKRLLVVDERHPTAFEKIRLKGAFNLHTSLFNNERDRSYFLWQKVKDRLGGGEKIETVLLIPEHEKLTHLPDTHQFVKFVRTTPGIASNATVFPLPVTIHDMHIKYPFLFETGANTSTDEDELDEELDAPPWPSEILPSFLYLGNYQAATDKYTLNTLGIKYILNVSQEENFFSTNNNSNYEGEEEERKEGEQQTTQENEEENETFKYCQISIPDKKTADIRSHFASAVAFIEEARCQSAPVLVHCVAGISRSAAIVIAYLMATRGWSLEEAHEFVKERRRIIKPNSSFVQQLREWEEELNEKGSEQPN